MIELGSKRLLNVKELCEYINMGQTNARRLLNSRDCTFCVRIGGRVFADKKKLDDWIEALSDRRATTSASLRAEA